MINLSDTLISDLYVGTSQVSAAFLGTTQVYPNAPLPPIMGTFSAQSDTTATPEPYDDTNSVYLTVTTDNGNFTVTDAQNNTSIFMDYPGGKLSPVTSITRMRLTPSSCLNMFADLRYVTSINTSGLNTSNARDMSNMFYGCRSLASIDVSHFDTSSAQSMQQMFYDCQSLTSIDVSHFDTSNVSDMRHMFYHARSLTSLDLSGFDYSRAYMFDGMFDGCSSLATLNISNFVIRASYTTDMFATVQPTCVITMNNVDNNTFDVLTDYNTTGLDTSIIIFRDGARYEYDATEDKWIISQQPNTISGTTSSANRTYTNALRINGVYHDVVTDANGDFMFDLWSDKFAYPGNGASYGDLLSGNSDFRTQLLSIDFTNMQYAQYVDLSNMFCWSPTPNLQHVYFDFSNAIQSSFACGGGFLRQLPANSRVHGLGTLRWSDTIHTDSNFIGGYACMQFREFAQYTISGTFDIRGIDTTRITDQSYSGLPQAYNPSSFQGPYYNFIQLARFDTLIIGNYEVQNTNISGSYLSNITTLYCTSQTPPSLNRTGANGLVAQNYVSKLTGLQNIYVPTGCLSVYQNAPIWSQYANLMSELDAPNPLTI